MSRKDSSPRDGIVTGAALTTTFQLIIEFCFSDPASKDWNVMLSGFAPILASVIGYLVYRYQIANELPEEYVKQRTIINTQINQIKKQLKCELLTPAHIEEKTQELSDAYKALNAILVLKK